MLSSEASKVDPAYSHTLGQRARLASPRLHPRLSGVLVFFHAVNLQLQQSHPLIHICKGDVNSASWSSIGMREVEIT